MFYGKMFLPIPCSSFICLALLFVSMSSLTSSENLIIPLRFTSRTQSNISTEAVIKAINELIEPHETNLQFLYGSEYEDSLHGLSKSLSKRLIGQMRLINDGSFESLQQLLIPSIRPVLLVVLERPVNIINIFQKIRVKRLNSHLVKWLVVMEEKSSDNSIVEIGEVINEGTSVTICRINQDGYCDLFFPYIDSKGVTRFTGKTTIRDKQLMAKNRLTYYSLNGRHMKLATKGIMVAVKLGRTLPDGSVEVESGTDVDLLKILSVKLNFTYRVYIPDDNKWGNLQPDGSVTGLIGMVARREVTFGFSGLVLSESRESVIDFAWFSFGDNSLILSRSPKEKPKELAVLSPFKLKVWVSICTAVLFMGPVVYLFSQLVERYIAEDLKTDLMWYEFNMFRGVVNQGVLIKDSSASLRLILIFWLLFSVIFTAIYSGMLTATFVLPAYETPIDSLEDLPGAVREGFSIGTLYDSSYEQFFKTSPDGIFKQTWNLFNHEDRSKSFVSSNMEGARKAMSEKYAFITSAIFSRYLRRVFGVENFHLSRETFNPITIGFVCQTGSPVRDTLFYMMLRLQDAGIMFKWLDDQFRSIPQGQSTDDEGKKSSSINLNHLQAAFYLLFLGMLIASIALVMETATFTK